MNGLQKQEAEEKLRLALDLFLAGYEMMLKTLKRNHPEASEEEITKMHTQWLRTRSGAEFGDAEGTPGKNRF